ncbi:undecaprenyldiphospho-muramoylpentapeptide beta-N-acetylglucosaminyltransferase [Aureimonas populi]|uniref:UDP-N-acetylglucosamine--N-acetylmuramyl-(pentapeptide) pyrophosphoryl-undecaprenol N-acetylglucosamine transferase n=1 Tax=Aureimonas populi TaxID=1701758 RepID=A0ABW5CJ92_9HYPH|nr:undecaprenyldiphospho-muramoylpentapeptide beta-N-acetylglucosaminyltransferase [Aureimonas populi]
MTGPILLCAGGTGGHLFPAQALAHELIARGRTVHLVTDERAGRFLDGFPAAAIHPVPSATFGSKRPDRMAASFWRIWKGFRASGALIRSLKPQVVVGFGGYPTVPPMMAAQQAGKPTIVHEQNAVMGRANRMLAARATKVAAGFPQGNPKPALAQKLVVTGNPVRPAAIEAAAIPYEPSGEGQPFRLVVFGGSQGASFFSQALPQAIELLPEALVRRLEVTQQARADEEAQVRAFYAGRSIPAIVAPFLPDMAERIGRAHLVVSRSGASTVSELSVIGRPSILVPYPYALDHDQAANAARLEAAGGTIVARQSELSAERLAALIARIAEDRDEAARMAAAARATGIPDAARLLADLVDSMSADSL